MRVRTSEPSAPSMQRWSKDRVRVTTGHARQQLGHALSVPRERADLHPPDGSVGRGSGLVAALVSRSGLVAALVSRSGETLCTPVRGLRLFSTPESTGLSNAS